MGLSVRYRLYLLILGVILAFTAAWKFSISKTVELTYRNMELAEIGENVDELLNGVQQASNEQSMLAANAGSMTGSPEQYRRELLNSVDNLLKDHSAQIVYFEPMQRYELEGFEIFLNSITIQGDFQELIKICHHLEINTSNGKLVNVFFRKQTNRRTRKTELHATYIIQSLRSTI